MRPLASQTGARASNVICPKGLVLTDICYDGTMLVMGTTRGRVRELLLRARERKKKLAALRLESRTRQASSECVSLIIDYLRVTEETMSIHCAVRLTDHLPPKAAAQILVGMYDRHDPDLGYDIVGKLARCGGPRVRAVLFGALDEKDAMLRANAVEVLGFKKELAAGSRLVRLMNSDPDAIVRGCAASALGDLGQRSAIPALNKALNHERRRAVKLRIMGSLWTLGVKPQFTAIFKYLADSNYRNRCAAVNILADAKNDEVQAVRGAFARLLRREPTRAVRSTIRSALRNLKKGKIR